MTGADALSGRRLRVAVQLQQQHADYADLRRAAAQAEEAGVDVIFNWDHFFPIDGSDGKHFECWTMLGAWAEATSRVEIGALVTCAGYRNPDLLADMARTVDHISGGRLVLGLGAGWLERDYLEYGFPFDRRADRLDATIERMLARWATLNPAPLRRIPVLIGGGGENRTLSTAARHADIWHGFGDNRVIGRKNAVLDGWCWDQGRDPAQIERSVTVTADPDAVGEELLIAGAALFVVGVGGPDFDLELTRRWLAWRDVRNRNR